MNRHSLLAALASFLVAAFTSRPAPAQTVTNVRAQQLPDKTVEVLYDLAGAATGGATVSIAFSSSGGEDYSIVPAPATRSGHVGNGVASGTNRRIVWNAAGTLAAGTYGTSFKAAVTASNPASGGQEVTYMLRGVPLVMVKIPGGTFQMGAPATERGRNSDETLHQVTLTSDYYIGKYEVTQAQWEAVMGTNPSLYPSCGPTCPVDNVFSYQIRNGGEFVSRVNQLLGTTKFRLPTEAEWEWAARGGTQTRFSFGDALTGDDACGTNAEASPYVWWCGNAGSATQPVGAKAPNPYGLHDMHGNVAEWVEDWYDKYPSTAQTNPTGPATGLLGVFRGGSCSSDLRNVRSARRFWADQDDRSPALGFRLAMSQ